MPTIFTKKLLAELMEAGWSLIENVASDYELESISNSVGHIVPHPNGKLIDKIVPNSGEGKVVGTLSNIFGLDRFPLHTDTAFWPTPARFVLLSCATVSKCDTYFVSKETIWRNLGPDAIKGAERAVFKIKTNSRQFYSSLIFRQDDVTGIKYDLTCMYPANKSAENFVANMRDIETRIEPNRVSWSGNKAIIFDNWKVLHGRGPAIINEDRLLKRIYINKN